MKHLGYITDANSIFLWFPSQNRTFLGRKPYETDVEPFNKTKTQ